MFHGVLTPNAVGLAKSAKRRKLILALANATLVACEKALVDWLTFLQKTEGDKFDAR